MVYFLLDEVFDYFFSSKEWRRELDEFINDDDEDVTEEDMSEDAYSVHESSEEESGSRKKKGKSKGKKR